jgi:hypothetical protein
MGHNGWISVKPPGKVAWGEIQSLIETRYRHCALTRMLRALGK